MTGFRLATVERLRERRAQLCVQELHQAGQELVRAQAARSAMDDGPQGAAPVGFATPAQLVIASYYRERLRGDIWDGDEEVARRALVVSQRRSAWLTANSQLRAITALHKHHTAARNAVIARQEQLDLDELAAGYRIIQPGADIEDTDHNDQIDDEKVPA